MACRSCCRARAVILSLNSHGCARREEALMTVVLQRAGNHEVDVLSPGCIGEEVLKVAPLEEHAIGSTIERRRAKNRRCALCLYAAGGPLVEVVRSIRRP